MDSTIWISQKHEIMCIAFIWRTLLSKAAYNKCIPKVIGQLQSTKMNPTSKLFL
uniref:Uncharacterized protein n=1 Tax=Anguilla anguilla TaxID=7936 RepID=A0A0E9QHG2_ANGAN